MMFLHRHHRTQTRLLGVIAALLMLLIAIGLLLLFSPHAAAAQAAAPQEGVRSAAVLLLKGTDTLVVQRLQRGPRSVQTTIAVKGAGSTEAILTLGPDHRITEGTYRFRGANAPADANPIQTLQLHFERDTAVIHITGAGGARDHRIASRDGALPIINNDVVIAEQAVRMARAQGVTTLTFPVFALSGGVTIDATIELIGRDSARFSIAGNVTDVAVDRDGNVTGGRVAAQGIDVVVVTGAAAAGITLGRPDYSAPADAPYTAEEVVVRTPAGHQLTGTLTLPRGATTSAKVPAVVTITGSGAQDRDEYIPVGPGMRLFRQVADTLGRRGIAVLRLDDRGVGGSGGDVAGTTADFADDIRAAVTYLRARPEIDGARIALVGHSEGGVIGPMVAAEDPRIAALALLAGTAYNGRQIIDYQIANGFEAATELSKAQRDSATKATIAQFDSTTARGNWMRFFLSYEPLPTARRVRQPTLILQGATDQQVRPEEARLLDREMRAAGNRQVTLHIFPDRNHLFLRDPDGHPSRYVRLTDARVDAEVMGTLADWLVTTLGVR